MNLIPAIEITRLSAILETAGPSTATWRTRRSITPQGGVGWAGGCSRLADLCCSPAACPSRKSHPHIAMVQSGKNWLGGGRSAPVLRIRAHGGPGHGVGHVLSRESYPRIAMM